MNSEDAMAACKMTAFRPRRRKNYVIRWTDPRTHERHERTAGTPVQRKALQLAADMARDIVQDDYRDAFPWDKFCGRYEQEHLSRLSPKSMESWRTTMYWLSQISRPAIIQEIDAAFVQRWQNQLRQRVPSEASVAAYSARLKAALNWAVEVGILGQAPKIRASVVDEPRSRAITLEEYERMVMAAEKVRPGDYTAWQRFLAGLWHSGFRLNELRSLSWDAAAPITIDVSGHFPVVRFTAKSHKKRREYLQPVTQEFWDLCCETPQDGRSGPIFLVPNGRGGQLSLKRLGRIISTIGDRAGVITNRDTGKRASAHDFRRAFATRMERVLSPGELQKWMRHADISTTMTYYHHADAQQLAAKVWGRER